MIELANETQIPLEGSFLAKESIEGRNFNVIFHWVPISEVDAIEIYPTDAKELLKCIDEGVKHFVYKE
jgi:hypothetical protein